MALDRETLKNIELGWPVSFYVQNQERFDPPFPYAMGWSWENPSEFLRDKFYISVAYNFFAVLAYFFVLQFAFKKILGAHYKKTLAMALLAVKKVLVLLAILWFLSIVTGSVLSSIKSKLSLPPPVMESPSIYIDVEEL